MQPKSLAILGRQPAIGLAELESLFGSDKVTALDQAALLNVDVKQVFFKRLGGSVKLARLLTPLDTIKWHEIEDYLLKTSPQHAKLLPPGKLKLGISAYGFNVGFKDVQRSALTLKKALSQSGRNVRVVPNKTADLSSAQVLHNNLVGKLGWELLLVRDGQKTWLAQTTAVQDIEAYAARDQARPKRDAKVGMLPPKLAQIIINLANPLAGATILDPFCGSGVIMQEALLMGFSAYGTDIEPRMVVFSQENLKWLKPEAGKWKLETADALNYKWKQPIDAVATEVYLGQPLSALPPSDQLDKIVNNVDRLLNQFLKNIWPQLRPNSRLSLAVPAWKTKSGFKQLPFLDHLEELGYNRLSFVHVKNEDLIYHRPDQIVARELLVLKRK